MAEWVLVSNNQILEYHDRLPTSWKNISGLDKASSDFLKEHGWLPVEKNHQSYDEQVSRLDGYDYEILENKVIETTRIVNFTEQEIIERNQNKIKDFFSFLRQQRNQKLMESDWTQAVDIQQIKEQLWIDEWKSYRQQLRDLPSKYENTQSYDYAIEWPKLPNT